MKKILRLRTALLITVLGMMCWLGFALHTPAQTDARLETRINRLESELGRVRTQVSRIESQLSNSPRPTTPPPQTPASPSLADPSLEEQFDNLATLAIELKLQVRDLEQRVAQLEANTP